MTLAGDPVISHSFRISLKPGIARAIIISLLFFFFDCGWASSAASAGSGNVILMRPCHREYKGVPLLEVMPASDPRARIVDEMIKHSFIGELVKLHEIIQDSLLARKLISSREPLYLLASGRMGGFPMRGFYLKSGGRILDKSDVQYVDLADVEKDYKKLQSITQIFPHEQAHIYLRQYSGFDPEKAQSYSSDMHYFSMLTNYSTAFDEGFAESFENISRKYEPDASVYSSVRKDAERISSILGQRTGGFDRDFRWPLRLGFYRLAMLLWYQPLENYKRFEWVYRGLARYPSKSFTSSSAEKSLLYLNACVIPDSLGSRNPAQCASTEGVVNTFFSLLMDSRAKEMNSSDPRLTPMQNQLMKEFGVIASLKPPQTGESSRFDDFVSAYICRYPSEKELVGEIYRKSCGFDFSSKAIPEIWLLNESARHNSLVMAQYGGSEMPYYTMNLNTARAADFLTFSGTDAETAEALVRFRDSIGGFRDISGLDQLPKGLKEFGKRLQQAKLDPAKLEKYGSEGGFSISRFFLFTGLRFVILAGIVWLIVFAVLVLVSRFARRPFTSLLKPALGLLFKVIMFLLVAVISFLFHWPPLLPFTLFSLIILGLNLYRTRKDSSRRKLILTSTLMIFALIGYSLV